MTGSSTWSTHRLDNVIEINPARSLTKGIQAPFISMADVPADARTSRPAGMRVFAGGGSRFRDGDTLFARITPCLENGKTCFVTGLGEGVAHGSGEFIVLSARTGITDPLFLYYLARSPEFRAYAIAKMEGSTGRQRVPADAIARYGVALPPLVDQAAIAHVLGALDDKIEANARLVPLLRDLAKALLQRAVDPKSLRCVGDVADVRKGVSYNGAGLTDAGMPMVNLANADNFGGWLKRSGFKYYAGAYKPRHVAPAQALLVSGVDLTWKLGIIGWPLLLPDDIDEALFSHHIFLVDFSPEHAWLRLPLWAHLYTFDARARLEGMAYGTTVATLPAEALTGLEFPAPRPDDSVLENAEGLLRRAWAAERENATLAALRDALLPPLISGEFRIRDAEGLVGETV